MQTKCSLNYFRAKCNNDIIEEKSESWLNDTLNDTSVVMGWLKTPLQLPTVQKGVKILIQKVICTLWITRAFYRNIRQNKYGYKINMNLTMMWPKCCYHCEGCGGCAGVSDRIVCVILLWLFWQLLCPYQGLVNLLCLFAWFRWFNFNCYLLHIYGKKVRSNYHFLNVKDWNTVSISGVAWSGWKHHKKTTQRVVSDQEG